jgi:hypothetical protein
MGGVAGVAVLVSALAAAVPIAEGSAGSGAGPTLEAATRARVIERLAEMLEARYVLPDLGARMALSLRERLSKAAYEPLGDPEAFARKLTDDLRAISQDGHLRVFWSSGPLREEGGGAIDPSAIALVCGYLLAERTLINELHWREGGKTRVEQSWTPGWVRGEPRRGRSAGRALRRVPSHRPRREPHDEDELGGHGGSPRRSDEQREGPRRRAPDGPGAPAGRGGVTGRPPSTSRPAGTRASSSSTAGGSPTRRTPRP